MAYKNKKKLILACAAVAAIAFAQPVFANQSKNNIILLPNADGQIGEKYPICKEVVEILKLPENLYAIDERTKVKDIVFPKNYKNFEAIEWQSITLDEAKKLTPDGYLDKVIAADKNYAVDIVKDWDGKGDFVFEKTVIAYDRKSPAETIIHYRLPSLSSWNCLFTKDSENPIATHFNPSEERGAALHSGEGCAFFRYGGRVYRTGVLASPTTGFLRVFMLHEDGYVWEEAICTIVKKK